MTIVRLRRRLEQVSPGYLAALLLLLSLIAFFPCAMALADGEPASVREGCPHCPPEPCHEPLPLDDCAGPEPAEPSRDLEFPELVLGPPLAEPITLAAVNRASVSLPALRPWPRAGPRTHLLHLRFHE